MENTIRKSVESVRYPDEGEMKGAACNTWTVQVADGMEKLFPECVQWLEKQVDGSWGGQVPNYCDRLFSTLSAVIASEEIDGRRCEQCIQRSEAYIWENLKKLKQENCKFVGSELLFSLTGQAESAGLDLPYCIKNYPVDVGLSSTVGASITYSTAVRNLCQGWSA